MKTISIEITNDQENFLKMFAQSRLETSENDGFYVHNPIHIVQNKKYKYIPYSRETAHFFDPETLRFCSCSEYSTWFRSEEDLVDDWYSMKKEYSCPIEILLFKEVKDQIFTGVGGEKVLIRTYEDYFKAYGVIITAIAWEESYYEDVAFFFIYAEAEKYLKYQGHNLKNPRIYSHSEGYCNGGEYSHFLKLLYDIGKNLIEK